MNILEQEIYAYFYGVLHQLCVGLYRIRMNLSGALMFLKSVEISRGAHADLIASHTRPVWSCIVTGMDFLFQEIYACSYGALHELRVRLYRIRMNLSGGPDVFKKC